jgi:hypothetical protein
VKTQVEIKKKFEQRCLVRKNMSISDVISLVQLLLDRHSGRKEQIAEYLDAIAQEAGKLAAVWREQFTRLANAHAAEQTDGKNRFNEKCECAKIMQGFLIDSLLFYSQSFDSVFKGNPDSKELELLKEELMALLFTREIAIDAVETLSAPDIGPPDHEHYELLSGFRDSLVQMHSQAVRLRVIANTYKAAK